MTFDWKTCQSGYTILYSPLLHYNKASLGNHNCPMLLIIVLCLPVLCTRGMIFGHTTSLFYFCHLVSKKVFEELRDYLPHQDIWWNAMLPAVFKSQLTFFKSGPLPCPYERGSVGFTKGGPDCILRFTVEFPGCTHYQILFHSLVPTNCKSPPWHHHLLSWILEEL